SSKGYSFKSNSDTEVIIYAYKEWGVECLQKFNGMFAFAIWDSVAQRLFAARDRLGVKPFYYAHASDHLVFASEIKSLLQSGLVVPEADYESLHTPAMYQAGPHTGFKGIQKLPAGHYLTFENGALQIRRYWQIEP